MTNQFRKQIDLLGLDEENKKKVIELIEEAGREFPCLACPSKDTCVLSNKWVTLSILGESGTVWTKMSRNLKDGSSKRSLKAN